jgi:hypothetical protein
LKLEEKQDETRVTSTAAIAIHSINRSQGASRKISSVGKALYEPNSKKREEQLKRNLHLQISRNNYDRRA